MSGAISAITRRKPNFFTSLAWHTIPWETSPRTLCDELCDIMIALPDLLQRQDRLSRRLASLQSNSDRFAALTEGQNHINRCTLIGGSLREWEQKALTACITISAPSIQNYTGPLTLLDVCKDHGYGFFHACMQYWTTCLVLFTTAWVTYRSVILARTEQPLSLPAWMRMPEVPDWMNPRPIASNIVTCSPHYFSDGAGFWGAQSASFPMGAALHYYAATTGGLDAEETAQLRRLLRNARLGKITSDFLRSVANTADSVKGDPQNRQEHKEMATSWYGIDKLEGRARSSST